MLKEPFGGIDNRERQDFTEILVAYINDDTKAIGHEHIRVPAGWRGEVRYVVCWSELFST